MSKLDPQLAFLVEGGVAQLEATADVEAVLERFGVERDTRRGGKAKPTAATGASVSVLAQYSGDPQALAKAGLRIHSISGDVVTGTVELNAVPSLAAIAEVERLEAARSMQVELDLSLVECRANLVHTGPPGRRGAGVIVGICDSGCDFTHPSFRRADGTSRILFIWDQGLNPQAGEAAPAGFGYGVEYNSAQINAALATANPFNQVRHRDPGGHGTHVSGIAAGDGSAPGNGQPAGTFIGVAPEADLIVVANRSNGAEGLGTSASTLDAVNYIFQHAGTLSRPCVVNMSLGDNLGPHDGTSLLERGLDNLLGTAGRAFVKSAGNAGAARCHAQATVPSGTTENIRFNQPANDAGANQIDMWYRGGDAFRVSVIDPAGNSVGPVNVGTAMTFNLPGGNTVRIDHRNNDPINGDRRVFMTFAPGAMGTMRSGNWTIQVNSLSSPNGGRLDAWIQRGNVVPEFLAPHENNARTISTPGTAREVITAGNYVSRGAGVGSLASTSSRGPTRDGRVAPTLAAPGRIIMSADGESTSGGPYRPDGGTSMAAPHVTGTIALMLQKNRSRTQAQIKSCLESSARSDAQTGPVPNTAWGSGKLDANAAVACVPAVRIQSVVNICPQPSTVGPCRFPSVISPCRSITLPCNSQVPALCGGTTSVTGACISVVGACASVLAGCISRIGCPSVVDGCPSTPGGCVVDPLIGGGGVINPGLGSGINPPVPAAPLPAGWAPSFNLPANVEAQSPVELPDQGFFDYDESWFDEEER